MTTVHRLPRSGDIEGCSTPDVPAVFLDRDGTLTRDVRHSADPENLALLPGVGLALSVLHGAGYALVVVANQSGVARGCFTEAAARAMGERLGRLVAEAGARLDGYYFCPHAAMDVTDEKGLACLCRKPAPGLLFRAAAELGLSLHRSWMVGDRVTDARAGWAAGCRSVLVDIGDESVAAGSPLPLVARNVPHAAKLMLAADGWLGGVRVRPAASDELRSRRITDDRQDGQASPWPDEEHGRRAAADAVELTRLAEAAPGSRIGRH